MNIVLYGISEENARLLAEQYDLNVCHSFENIEGSNWLLVQRELISAQQQLAFYERMSIYDESIDAVIAARTDDLSIIHYCSQPGKFFTVNDEPDDQALEYELARIIETQLPSVDD